MITIRTAQELADFADQYGLRDDWHEPDEQGITARVEGDEFDNATTAGEWYGGFPPTLKPRAELHVIFSRDVAYNYGLTHYEDIAVVSLANLCAWGALAGRGPEVHQPEVQPATPKTWAVKGIEIRSPLNLVALPGGLILRQRFARAQVDPKIGLYGSIDVMGSVSADGQETMVTAHWAFTMTDGTVRNKEQSWKIAADKRGVFMTMLVHDPGAVWYSLTGKRRKGVTSYVEILRPQICS